jgi:2-phosphosulfolactate phosphatase
MRVRRATLEECARVEGATVVIDVLRSFTTAAVAFARGASRIVAVDSIEAARRAAARGPGALLVGAHPGGAPIPGFDLPNSPSRIAREDVAGRSIVLLTAGGVRGLVAARRASIVFAGSLVCAGATVRELKALRVPEVTLVVTGVWTDRDGDEDIACADLLAARLGGGDPAIEPYAARVRHSDFGRRFAAGIDPSLPPADLDLCATADRYAFAMPVRREPDGEAVEILCMPVEPQ